MPVYDPGFKIAAHTSAPQLAEVAGLSCSHWRPIVSEVQVAERFADRAFRATHDGQRCVVYFEAYTRWPRDALWNVFAKAGLLSEREKLPTVAVLYILRPRGYKELSGEFQLCVGERPTQKLWYVPVPLWQQKPQDWWETSPGLMTLYPLTDHGQPAKQAVEHAAGAIRHIVPEPDLQANLLASLAFFGQLAYPEIDFVQLVGGSQMRQSRLYRQIVAEGHRTSILEALDERFGKEVADSFAPALEKVVKEAELSRLHRLAIRCANPAEFQAGIPSKK